MHNTPVFHGDAKASGLTANKHTLVNVTQNVKILLLKFLDTNWNI